MSSSKRPASDLDPIDTDSNSPPSDEETYSIPPPQFSAAPLVIRRHNHRHRPHEALYHTITATTPPFNIYKAIIRQANLFHHFAIRLSPQTMLDLYAIDKEFHWIMNKYLSSIIYDHTAYHAPTAAFVFAWSLYPDLCISDPLLRPMDNRAHLARDIPSLRWTQMVLHRESIVREILTLLAIDGHRLPRKTETVFMKLWVLMEQPRRQLREAFVRDSSLWSNAELLVFHLLLVKLDLRFAHPIQGQGIGELSRLLLTQKSLCVLLDVLKRKVLRNYDELTQMVVRTYDPRIVLDVETHEWLEDESDHNILAEYYGLLTKERWRTDGESMPSAVETLEMETMRRGLRVQRFLWEFVLYGVVDEATGRDRPVARCWRGDGRVVVPERGPVGREEVGRMMNLLGKRMVDIGLRGQGDENEWRERNGLVRELERQGHRDLPGSWNPELE